MRFFFYASYYKHIEHATEGLATWSTAQSTAALDASGNPTGSNPIVPGYTENVTRVRPVTSSLFTIRPRNNYKDAKTVHLPFGRGTNGVNPLLAGRRELWQQQPAG